MTPHVLTSCLNSRNRSSNTMHATLPFGSNEVNSSEQCGRREHAWLSSEHAQCIVIRKTDYGMTSTSFITHFDPFNPYESENEAEYKCFG